MTTEAQKRAMRKYMAKKRTDDVFRVDYNNKTNDILKRRYREDATFRENRKEYSNLQYYYQDAEDKAIKAIRRLF
jgi:hypothetical protein